MRRDPLMNWMETHRPNFTIVLGVVLALVVIVALIRLA